MWQRQKGIWNCEESATLFIHTKLFPADVWSDFFLLTPLTYGNNKHYRDKKLITVTRRKYRTNRYIYFQKQKVGRQKSHVQEMPLLLQKYRWLYSGVSNIWSTGHTWPLQPLDPACRARGPCPQLCWAARSWARIRWKGVSLCCT